ncbi:MAG: MFS transporter [Oscillospiraceae bacterium]|nr:MFS transporter [Oscillospiraceae bacterium]
MLENNATKKINSRALMIVLLLIALIQMPQGAIMPAIEHISTEVFYEHSLQSVQTAMGLISFFSVATGVIGAMVIKFGLASKKFITLLGMAFISAAGVTAFFLNDAFWHLWFLNILIGAGMGLCIPNSQSIMFDNFDEAKRQFMSGMTSAFLSVGGVVMSVAGGLLVTVVWFGGYLMTLLTIPVIFIGLAVIPRDKRISPKDTAARSKLPKSVFFYAFLIFLFSILFNVGGMNISTHIASGEIGDAALAGTANAMPMLGGILMGLLFIKVSMALGDYLLPLAFALLFVGFTMLNLFPTSLVMTLVAMFIMGLGLSMLMPRCLFNVSNITDPSNSSTATMLVLSIAPGGGGFLSPVIMTNLTYALGGDSTRFRYQFTAFVCLLVAALAFMYVKRGSKAAKA